MSDTATPLFSETAAATATSEPPVTDAPAPAPVDYEWVRTPDGQVHAVPKAAIVDAPVTAVSEHVAQAQADAPEELYYVWLANGQVRKVKESDLPPVAGTNAQNGLWVEGGKTYVIAGVYPVEHPR